MKQNPYRRAKTVPAILRVLDNEIKAEVPKNNSCIDCFNTEQTPHCCYRFVDASVLEARAALAEANKQGFQIDEELAQRATDYCEQSGVTRESYRAENMPCIFLTEHKRCAVYKARPVSCRAMVMTSPPEYCDPTNDNKPTKVGDTMFLATEAYQEIRHAHFTKGVRPTVGSLPALVLSQMKNKKRKKEGASLGKQGVTPDAVKVILPKTDSICQIKNENG